MALNGCSTGLVVTAVVALLLLPAQYYVSDMYAVEDPLAEQPESAPGALAWFDGASVHLPPLDLFVTVTLLLIWMATYLCTWIQRKLMERRIVKLNQYLGASVERLRAKDAQQGQLEVTLKIVQNTLSSRAAPPAGPPQRTGRGRSTAPETAAALPPPSPPARSNIHLAPLVTIKE